MTNTRKKKKTNSKASSRARSLHAKQQMSRKRKNRKKLMMVSGLVAALALVIGLGVYFALSSAANKVPEGTIGDNIYIDSFEVSGMTAKEAKAFLEKQLEEYQKLTVKLTVEEASAEVTLAELGFQMKNTDKLIKTAVTYGKMGGLWERYQAVKDLEKEKQVYDLVYAVDEKAIVDTIAKKIPTLKNAARDASVTRANGRFVITSEVKGVAVDAEESAKVIETYMNEKWSADLETPEVVLVTTVDEPKVTKAQLEQIQDVLGKFTTNCGTGGGRVQNIVSGAKFINGSVLMPGEELSADAKMRPYTTENGYAEAGSYENGKVVQSMGGGICQVSSTLYNAVILAELEITQRMPHSMMVGYVEPSMDAAIAGDYKDLKFKNNTEYPIYIEGYVEKGYITFVIYGKETRAENRRIEYVSEVLSSTPPTKKFVTSDASIGTNKTVDAGHTAMKAQLWKVIYENGVEASRKVINKSNYRSSEATVSIGIASSSAAATELVKNAVASQNEATINAAIAQAKDIIAKEQAAAQQQPTTPEVAPQTQQSEAQQ